MSIISSIFRKYLCYSAPAVFELPLFSISTLLNGAVVAKWVNPTAMGAVGIAVKALRIYSLFFLLVAFSVASIGFFQPWKSPKNLSRSLFSGAYLESG